MPEWLSRSDITYQMALYAITGGLAMLIALIAGVLVMVTRSGWVIVGFAIIEAALGAVHIYFFRRIVSPRN
jgi:hypothetical protein